MLYIFASSFAFLLNQKQQKYFLSSLFVSLEPFLVLLLFDFFSLIFGF